MAARPTESGIFGWIAGALALGVLALVLLGWKTTGVLGPWVLLLLALASALIGSFLGLLFGTPERRTQSDPKATAESPSGFRTSDNLKQIADWLTKIIVGVTLTQFTSIVGFLDQAATFAASAFEAGGKIPLWGKSAGFSVMLLNGAAGFWYGYIWTVRNLAQIFRDADRDEVVRAAQDGTLQKQTARAVQPAALQGPDGIQPGPDHDDPWKNAFGGLSKVGDWELTASVEALTISQLFRVTLRCKNNQKKQNALVKFFLHPTFSKQIRPVPTNAEGIAELRLIAWGAFTAGVLTDDQQKLELDLSTIDAPAIFRNR
jgi:hypothetical protein